MFSCSVVASSHDQDASSSNTELDLATTSDVLVKKESGIDVFIKHAWDNQAPLWQGIYAVKQDQTQSQIKTRSYLAMASIPEKYQPILTREISKYKALTDQERADHLDRHMKEAICEDIPELAGQYGVVAACDIPPYQLLGHYAGWAMSEAEYDELSKAVEGELERKNKATHVVISSIDTYAFALPDGNFLSGHRYGNITTRINANTTHSSGCTAQAPNLACLGHKDGGRWLIFLYSLAQISKGASLLFDYGKEYWDNQRQIIDLTSLSDDETTADCHTMVEQTSSATTSTPSKSPDTPQTKNKQLPCSHCKKSLKITVS